MYTIQPTHSFNAAKKKLRKKYPHLEDDYASLIENLRRGEFHGDEIQGLFGKVYKVRVSSSDQKRGKRGGFRIIYYVVMDDYIVYLLFIYAKAKRETIDVKEIQAILDSMN